MKKIALLILTLPLLIACGDQKSPDSFDVSGKLLGEIPGRPVLLSMIATSLGGVIDEKVDQVPVKLLSKGAFAIDFPKQPYDGAYQVIAYLDKNGNNKYDLGEQRTQNNKKYLVHSQNDSLGYKKGWNLMDAGIISQPEKVLDYDLQW